MSRNVHFYNHYGNGDIFISKEFVKDICIKYPAETYYYAHAKNKRILGDMHFLKWEPIQDIHAMRKYYFFSGEDLYINTWMGVTSKYVPTNSCTISNALKMYNDTLWQAGLHMLTGRPIDYLPVIGYQYFQTENVDFFVKEVPQFILIDTCNVQSNQAENFDFYPVIDALAQAFPSLAFVTTTKIDLGRGNVIYTGDITGAPDGFDLNEISYLSTFTKLIVGRSSGPAVFCMTRENCFDPDKTFLSFTYKKVAAHIVDWEIEIPARRIWSNAVSPESVCGEIYSVIKEKFNV